MKTILSIIFSGLSAWIDSRVEADKDRDIRMSNDRRNYTVTPTIEDKDIYKNILDTRNFEIALFWQRSNYFLVLNSALAIGFFNLQKQEYALLLAFLGILVSMFWYRVNLGSKYWQSRWEHRLSLIENQIAPDLKCFAATPDIIKNDVRESISTHTKKSLLHKRIEQAMLKEKPSVSYNMILLSFTFVIGWAILFVIKFDIPAQFKVDWRIPLRSELKVDESGWRKENIDLYLVAKADFDGDGQEDIAKLLINEKENKIGLLVTLTTRKNAPPLLLETIDDKKQIIGMGIRIVNPGKYKTACGKGYWVCKNNEPEILILQLPTIDLFQYESANSYFVWNGERKKFEKVWMSD